MWKHVATKIDQHFLKCEKKNKKENPPSTLVMSPALDGLGCSSCLPVFFPSTPVKVMFCHVF